MACITEAASGFPNASGHIPGECAMIPAILGELGWNTYIVGKWHLTPEDEMNNASTKKDWPLGRGFERFYGFLGAETNQWYPDLTYDNHSVEQPSLPEEGYHFSVDITDKALSFIKDAKVVAPNKPFFLYYSFGAAHAPAPRAEGVGGQVQGQVRHGLRGLPRARVREPEEARDHRRPRRAVADQSLHGPEGPEGPELGRARRRSSLGLAHGRREAALLADGRGLRRLPQPRRRPARTGARLPREERSARQHADRARLRQRRLGRRRPERLRSTRTRFSTGCRTRSRRPSSTSTTSAPRGRTTTIRPVGPGRSTRRSRCGSATRATRAARPTR